MMMQMQAMWEETIRCFPEHQLDPILHAKKYLKVVQSTQQNVCTKFEAGLLKDDGEKPMCLIEGSG